MKSSKTFNSYTNMPEIKGTYHLAAFIILLNDIELKNLYTIRIALLFTCITAFSQPTNELVQKFYAEQKELGRPIWNYIFNDFSAFNSQSPSAFEKQVDSLRRIYSGHLLSYSNRLPDSLYQQEEAGIKLAFDKLLLEYDFHHSTYSGDTATLSASTYEYLSDNRKYYNDPFFFQNNDIQVYLTSVINRKANQLVAVEIQVADNKYLNAKWQVIKELFSNPTILEHRQLTLLIDHMENLGIKNLRPYVDEFIKNAPSKDAVEKVNKLYKEAYDHYSDHTRLTYKTIDGLDLELHLFSPENLQGKAPAIVYFHGGSWSEGKPDWFFESAKNRAANGWVAVAVEYRIKERHNTLPFESVKDAKSAIRYLREHAEKLHIDPDKIVVTGNSAGGHLSLATALMDSVNNANDPLEISAQPNAIMVNAAVYDLTVTNSKWIVRDFENKEIVQSISPNHNIQKIDAPLLLIHGEEDRNCEYATAQYFYKEMKAQGNDVEMVSIPEAGHFIWFGRHAGTVYPKQEAFLNQLNFFE